MAGRRVYGGSDMAALLQNEGISAGAFEALISSTSSRSGFNGSRSMLNFEEVCGNSINQNFYRPREMEEMGDDDFDECLHQPEKKRRLTTEQVQFLEKSFEVENKLEPERKIQLAKDLGLQPRQVAIWFQNRRARWKTKQLERDYDVLKSSFNVLKSDYDNLLKEKDKLKAEVVHLTDKLLLREKLKGTEEDFKVKQSENNPTTEEQNSESRVTEVKHEDHSSTNSAIFDSESPHYTDGARTDSARTDSSNAVEPGQSDISYIEDEGEVKGYRHFLKLEDCSPSFDFPVEDQTFWFWP